MATKRSVLVTIYFLKSKMNGIEDRDICITDTGAHFLVLTLYESLSQRP